MKRTKCACCWWILVLTGRVMLESCIKASREGSAGILRLCARAHLAPRERPQPPSRSQGRLSLQAELAYLLNL